MLTAELDSVQGVVAEGVLRLPARQEINAETGLYLEADGQTYEFRIDSGGRVKAGPAARPAGGFAPAKTVDRALTLASRVRFRLLARQGMLELYLDGHFIECLAMKAPEARRLRIGLAADREQMLESVWQMSL